MLGTNEEEEERGKRRTTPIWEAGNGCSDSPGYRIYDIAGS